MIKSGNQADGFTWSGRFRDDTLERNFEIFAWPEDRRTFLAIAAVVALVFSAIIVFDGIAFGLGTSAFNLVLVTRLLVIGTTIALACEVYKSEEFKSFETKALFQELLIVADYLFVASMLPEYIDLQLAASSVALTIIWFVIPVSARSSLITTGFLLTGLFVLQFRFSDNEAGAILLSALFYATLVLTGVDVARRRERIKRNAYLREVERDRALRELEHQVDSRKRAEKEALMARDRFEILFRAAPMPLALISSTNRLIESVNEAACSLIELDASKIIGRKTVDFFETFDPDQKLRNEILSKRKLVKGSINLRTGTGQVRECAFATVALKLDDSGDTKILAAVSDITERKEYERNLIQAHKEAEEARNTQTNFLATMSHEIRTPLNAVLGMLQIVELSNVDEEVRSNLAIARQSGEHLLHLISDILEISRMSSKSIELSLKDVDCVALCEENVETFRGTLSNSPVRLSKNLDLPQRIYRLDETRVRQVLFNLIGNAIKFSEEGDVEISVRELSVSTAGDARLRFEVRDTGIGIESSKIDEMFNEFTQGDSGSTRHYQGSGLGLAISKRLIEAMGGEIGAFENQPKGSVFWFEIPSARGGAKVRQPSISNEKLEIKEVKGRHPVLVAEDNLMNQRVMQVFLQKLGLDCVVVENGQAAIDLLQQSDFAIVLMDIQMPVLDGLSATKAIRSGATPRPDIPIVVVSANAMSGDRENYLAAGADDYIAKPITLDALKSVLQKYSVFDEVAPGEGQASTRFA